MSIKQLPLLPGRKYRVLKDFRSGYTFHKGEHLEFVRCQGYSRYDEAFVYEFRSSSGDLKTWSASADLIEQDLWNFLTLLQVE